jgi:hypothetical protein
MWADDAQAFLAWLNAIAVSNGEALHRLPTAAELDELAAAPGPAAHLFTSSVRTAWTRPAPEHPPQRWTAADNWAPDTVTGADVLAAVSQDVRRSSIVASLLSSAVPAIVYALTCNGDRTLDRAMALTGMLTSARSLQIDLVSARGMRPARDLAHEVRRAVVRDSELAIALERALALQPAIDDRTLPWIQRALARYRDHELSVDLEHVLSLDRDIAIAMEWHQDLGLGGAIAQVQILKDKLKSSRERIAALVDARARGVSGASPADSTVPLRRLSSEDTETDLDLNTTLDFAMGRGCRIALTATLERARAGPSARFEVIFARSLVKAAQLPAERRLVIAPENLLRTLRTASETLTKPPITSTWATITIAQLASTAEPLFTRRIPVDRDRSSQIRLSALALTAHADRTHGKGVGELLRAIAGGVTLLQLRGARTSDLEILVLARA